MSVATEIQRLNNAKADIRAAIIDKGVDVPASSKIDEYDDYISQITGGGGGAAAFGTRFSEGTIPGLPDDATYKDLWTDGDDLYCTKSNGYNKEPSHWIYNKTTKTFESTTAITGADPYYWESDYVWTDGTDIYYFAFDDSGNRQMVFDKSTKTWSNTSWSEQSFSLWTYGNSMWTDGENIYYSGGYDQLRFDKDTSTWSKKTWSGLTSIRGDYVWTDRDNIYYSNGTSQYVLDKSTSTWTKKTWSGLTSFTDDQVWTNGTNIYYSNGIDNYVLDKSTSTWNKTELFGTFTSNAYRVSFEDGVFLPRTGTNTYSLLFDYSKYKASNSEVYDINSKTKLDRYTSSDLKSMAPVVDKFDGADVVSGNDIVVKIDEYSGINLGNNYIWTDGDNIYYSSGTQYKFDKESNIFVPYMFDKFFATASGNYVWTDGDNIYYSVGSSQYVFDKDTSTWSKKTWSGFTSFSGNYVWTDRDNIYCSNGTSQYVLDKETSTWTKKTWSGLTTPNSTYIWTDGDNIYYSYNSTQYVLDKETSTWATKTWSGSTSFSGNQIWTDGTDIYYSGGSGIKYKLDKETSYWSQISVTGLNYSYLNGNSIFSTDPTKNCKCSCLCSTFGQDRSFDYNTTPIYYLLYSLSFNSTTGVQSKCYNSSKLKSVSTASLTFEDYDWYIKYNSVGAITDGAVSPIENLYNPKP